MLLTDPHEVVPAMLLHMLHGEQSTLLLVFLALTC